MLNKEPRIIRGEPQAYKQAVLRMGRMEAYQKVLDAVKQGQSTDEIRTLLETEMEKIANVEQRA